MATAAAMLAYAGKHRYTMMVKMVIKFCLAVYTAYALCENYVRLSRTVVSLQLSPPSDQCIPFFDRVSSLVDSHAGQVIAAYDYISGTALVRVCTSLNISDVTDAVGGFRYDPLESIGCPLANSTILQYVSTHCDHSSVIENCSQIISTVPGTNGYDWRFQAEKTNSTCEIKFTYLSNPLGLCNLSAVASYRSQYPIGQSVIFASILIPVIVAGSQLLAFAVSFFAYREYMWGWVMEGVLAPFLYLFWCFAYRRKNFPDVKLNIGLWLILFASVGVEGLITPIIYWKNCGLKRYPAQLALLILKVIQLVYITVVFWVPWTLEKIWPSPIVQQDSLGTDNTIVLEHSNFEHLKGSSYSDKQPVSDAAPGDETVLPTEEFLKSLPAVLRGCDDSWCGSKSSGLWFSETLNVWYDPMTKMVCSASKQPAEWCDPNEVHLASTSAEFSSVY